MCRQRTSRSTASVNIGVPQEMNDMERGHLLPPTGSHNSVQIVNPTTTTITIPSPPRGWFKSSETTTAISPPIGWFESTETTTIKTLD